MVTCNNFNILSTLSPCIKKLLNQTPQLFAPHPRPHPGEQFWCWPPWLIHSQFFNLRVQSGDIESDSRFYTFWNFTNQFHSAPHQHQHVPNHIWITPIKGFGKIQNFSLSAITSNTLCAILWKVHTLFYLLVFRLHHHTNDHHWPLLTPLEQSRALVPQYHERNDQNLTMSSPHANTMPSSALALSSDPHLVYWLALNLLCTLVPSLAKAEHDSAQNSTRPGAPGHARARQDTPWTRQCARSPRRIRPPLAPSSRTRTPLRTS
jgi:hypothetical protein